MYVWCMCDVCVMYVWCMCDVCVMYVWCMCDVCVMYVWCMSSPLSLPLPPPPSLLFFSLHTLFPLWWGFVACIERIYKVWRPTLFHCSISSIGLMSPRSWVRHGARYFATPPRTHKPKKTSNAFNPHTLLCLPIENEESPPNFLFRTRNSDLIKTVHKTWAANPSKHFAQLEYLLPPSPSDCATISRDNPYLRCTAPQIKLSTWGCGLPMIPWLRKALGVTPTIWHPAGLF